jgi:dihydroflavonol-4-reductase
MGQGQGDWSGRRVCVTGGTGLLGYQIVRRLLGLGASVRVLALPPRGPHPLDREPRVELTLGDVRDPGLVRRAVDGCDVVFHLAGVVAVWGPALERVRDVHVLGTSNVLEAAPTSARVVVTSSVMTVGASLDRRPLDEDSPFRLEHLRIDYLHAKRAAERIAMEHAGRGRDVVVTNPGYLIGPEDFERSVMGRFCVRYWRGMLPVAPPGGVNLVDVRDVARGHLLAAEQGRPGRRYILGGENRTFAGFMAALAEVVGFRPRAKLVLPYWGITALAGCSECRAWLTRRHPYPALQHARLNRYHWFYRSDRAARELGYTSRPLGESLDDTFRWFASRKTLRPRGAGHWWMRPEPRAGRAA